MFDQSFTKKQFNYLSNQGDYKKYFHGSTPVEKQNDKKEKLIKIEELIDFSNYNFLPLEKFLIKQNTVFKLPKINNNLLDVLRDDYVLRKINKNLKRIYKVKQADRYKIIKSVKLLLSQDTPCYVCKLDIKRFYENIDSNKILDKISESALVSYETKLLLKKFFGSLPRNFKGLPRGINISATLSEYYMKDFDSYIKTIKNFYYYSRFVDDIIIFSTIPITEKFIKDDLQKKLPDGLFFNSKTEIHDLSVGAEEPKVKINYLGYEFLCEYKKVKNKKQAIKEVKTRIAEKKLNKIKTKIILSFLDYKKNKDFELLKNRILFLTATYPLKTSKQKISNYEVSGHLHGGLFYSYPLIDDECCLKQLDSFLHNTLFSQKSSVATILKPLDKIKLKKYSFLEGFKRRISRKYKPNYLKQIVKCWS